MGALFSLACCGASCACTTLTNLLCCCCRGSSNNSTAPAFNPSAGRKRSVCLLLFSIAISLVLQYWVAPKYHYARLDYAWGCDDNPDYVGFEDQCRANAAVYRVSFTSFAFFMLSAAGAASTRGFNSSHWFAKIIGYLLLLVVTMFMPSEVFDENGYLQLARVGASIFIVLQQIILIDLAYGWNDAWVANADADEQEEPGSGAFWLKALIGVSGFIFAIAYTCLGLLFKYFGGCTSNDTFNSLTLVLTLLAILFQLTGDEGSLLTSAIMTAYAVFLNYSAVANNPDATCNPQLGSDNWLSITIGIGFMFLSMAWTCFSASSNMTALFDDQRNSSQLALINNAVEDPEANKDAVKVQGVVTGGNDGGETGSNKNYGAANEQSGGDAMDTVRNSIGGDYDNAQAWRLNLVLACIAMWSAMVLTDWGTLNGDGENTTAANPAAGKTAMWMMMAAQWVALLLYMWTILAPRLFPDRDFS